MKITTLAEVINKYRDDVPTVYPSLLASIEAEEKKSKCINQEIEQLDHSSTQKEIISYFEENLISGEWKNAYDWFGAIFHHLSYDYLEYLLTILKVEHRKGPYYWVLQVIQWMPEEMGDPLLPNLKELANPINPAWKAGDIEKYFEVIAWMDENAEEFFLTLKDSPSELVAYRANYWLETYEAERMEEAEDE